MDAAPRGQSPQRGQQASATLQYVEDWIRLSDGQRRHQDNPRDVLVDESKQADIESLGDCLRALGDGQSLGDFSLTIVLYGGSSSEHSQTELAKNELERLVAEFTGVFTNADGNLFAETYNQLNAYLATVPGITR